MSDAQYEYLKRFVFEPHRIHPSDRWLVEAVILLGVVVLLLLLGVMGV